MSLRALIRWFQYRRLPFCWACSRGRTEPFRHAAGWKACDLLQPDGMRPLERDASIQRRGPEVDRRYLTFGWRKLTKLVLARDQKCYVAGCESPARYARHIEWSDTRFYDLANLQASCLEHDAEPGPEVVVPLKPGVITVHVEGLIPWKGRS